VGRFRVDIDEQYGVDKSVWPQYRKVYRALLNIGTDPKDGAGVLIVTARKNLGLTPVKARQWVFGHLVKEFPPS